MWPFTVLLRSNIYIYIFIKKHYFGIETCFGSLVLSLTMFEPPGRGNQVELKYPPRIS